MSDTAGLWFALTLLDSAPALMCRTLPLTPTFYLLLPFWICAQAYRYTEAWAPVSTCAHEHRLSDIFSSILLFLKLLPLGPHYTTSALIYRVGKRGFHAASEQRCNAPCISPLLRVPVLHLGYANDQHLEGHFLCTETHSLVLHSYPNPPTLGLGQDFFFPSPSHFFYCIPKHTLEVLSVQAEDYCAVSTRLLA